MTGNAKVLFVCTANQQRSPTAERMYEKDPRMDVDSAGTEAFFAKAVTEERLNWADLVVVMEERHARSIRERFPNAAERTRIVSLDIPDIYQFLEQRLQKEIRERFEPLFADFLEDRS